MNKLKSSSILDFGVNQLFHDLTNYFTVYCSFLALENEIVLAGEGKSLLKRIRNVIDSSVSSNYDFSVDLAELKKQVNERITSYNRENLCIALEGLNNAELLLGSIPDYEGTPVSFVKEKIFTEEALVSLSDEETLLAVSPSVIERIFSYFCNKAGNQFSLDGFLINYDYDFRISYRGERFCLNNVHKELYMFGGTLEQNLIGGVYLIDVAVPVKR